MPNQLAMRFELFSHRFYSGLDRGNCYFVESLQSTKGIAIEAIQVTLAQEANAVPKVSSVQE
jgi:hypothetical protein